MDSFEILQENISQNCFKKHERQRQIDFLILHHLQANSIAQTVEALEYHQVSAHFLIDKNGKIAQLVDENDIAFHAGVSCWNGFEGLNINSIGIEFINSDPFSNNFSQQQMLAGVDLASYLINKYNIQSRYVLGHSDIAYNSATGFLDRKQDPSHLFDWEFLARNNIGLYPKLFLDSAEESLKFELGDENSQIEKIKKNLQEFGYKVMNINDVFDEEMQMLTRVFNRHFNNKIDPRSLDLWLQSSDQILKELMKLI
jgi:N-acetyl-anhydromuramyl-L-alanine amidase AmpD